MPKAYRPELMWNYSPVIKPMPPLALDDVCGDKQVCVSFACEFIPYLLGLLEIYRWPDRFTGTPEEQEYSAGLFRELMEVFAMACCGDGTSSITQIVLHQINSITLQLEISVDGGQTWTPDPESPINQITAQPPPVPSGVSANKCDAATNGKQHIEDLIQRCHDYLGTAETVFDLAVGVCLAMLELAIAYFSGLTLAQAAAALASAIWSAAHAAFDYGIAAFDANWTTDERDKILCALYCNIGDDGAFTEEQYTAFLNNWESRAARNPAFYLVFKDIKAGGRVALNNMCSYGEAALADCSACECGCDTETWDLGYALGTIISRGSDTGGNYIQVETVADVTEFGLYGFVLISGGVDSCCSYQSVITVSGEAPTVIKLNQCGVAIPDYGVPWPGFGGAGSLINGILVAAPGMGVHKVYLGAS